MNDTEAKHELKEPTERLCLLCGRLCAIVRKQGALLLKAPCPNACSDGYIKPRKEQQK